MDDAYEDYQDRKMRRQMEPYGKWVFFLTIVIAILLFRWVGTAWK
jgi:hypothetical protein